MYIIILPVFVYRGDILCMVYLCGHQVEGDFFELPLLVVIFVYTYHNNVNNFKGVIM